MNKETLIIIILSAFILTISAVNFTAAQVPSVPEPTCVSVPGIPCPGEHLVTPTPKKQPSTPASNIGNNISKLFDYLITNINKIINDIIGGIRNIYDGLRK